MTAAAEAGRVFRTGRTLARVLFTWAAATGALVVLDSWLTGFAMRSWWHPPVAALLLGVLAAGLGALTFTTWPVQSPPTRVIRVVLLTLLVVAAVSKAL